MSDEPVDWERGEVPGVVVFDEAMVLTPEMLESIQRTTVRLGQAFTTFGRACNCTGCTLRRMFEAIIPLIEEQRVRRIVASQRRRRGK